MTTYYIPNRPTNTADDFMVSMNSAFGAAKRFMGRFVCHEQDTPNMTIRVEGGYIYDGVTLYEIPVRDTPAFTAPKLNRRYDRICVHPYSGAAVIVQGAATGSLLPPPIPGGYVPLCKILLSPDTVAITNSMITDERVLNLPSVAGAVTVFGDYVAGVGDLGRTILLADGPAVVTMPQLALVPIGQSIQIASFITKAQGVQPYPGDLIDLSPGSFRIPSYSSIRVVKVATNTWLITERPPNLVGEVIEGSALVTDSDSITRNYGPGWVPCNGTELSRTDFSNLAEVYALEGYPYGAGDGSTTFNLPFDHGRVTVTEGDAPSLIARVVGQSGGANEHILTQANMPFINYTVTDPGHYHSLSNFRTIFKNGTQHTIPLPDNPGRLAALSENNTTGATVHSGGSGLPHNNMQPFNAKIKFVRI